ncbi:transglutaminase family protein [Azoarcus sp. L1K30]|uniref:transglutaminase family protein n=1 Tax=Azoarcus sp. L1K30 TaxID=2820277 RepID=UPI001B822ACA|nr:transglutaminase family protein [Azoarcus sp. L1K30]MBR0565911.1 transglutaminase family protein [Azoarcus sp. L1K30]
MARLKVLHRTVYRYSEPVGFSEHRFMCRPRDSHDLRLVDTGISINPPATLRWIHDVFGNSVLVATFADKAAELMFESTFVAEHYPAAPDVDMVEAYAERLPFSYEASEIPDLARCNERQYGDPEHRVDAWVRQVCADAGTDRTLDVLIAITHAIKAQFTYEARDEEGTRSPVETLELGSGSCRDFALLMMEAVRSLGLAARFVSGYLYDESLVGAESGMVGGGASHAWVHVYLPGAGWLPFDPTNAIVGGRNLIRVAVARDPSQAAPLTGSFIGPANAYLGMTVEVKVSVEEAVTQGAE